MEKSFSVARRIGFLRRENEDRILCTRCYTLLER